MLTSRTLVRKVTIARSRASRPKIGALKYRLKTSQPLTFAASDKLAAAERRFIMVDIF
jgi:hypothetical protein